MTINYTWKITSLKVKNQNELENVVVQTYWEKMGTDENGNQGKFTGATPFSLTTSNNFTPFSELTEEIVLGWIKDIVIGEYEQHVNHQILKAIDLARNPVVETSLPWATSPTSTAI